MSSILKVSEIQDPTNGNTALTINSSGKLLSAGHVVQVVTGSVFDGNFSTTSSSWTATTLEVSLTPSATTSKIMVQFVGVIRVYNTSGNDARGAWRIYRKIGSGSYAQLDNHQMTHRAYDYGGSGLISDIPMMFQYFDDPQTTSAVSYKLYASKEAGSQMEMNPDGQDESYAFAMEIAQ